jgi:hypothetical protein
MLYNPQWEKLKPMTMPHFIAWLENHRGEETYTYHNARICLARQYCNYVGENYSPKWATRRSMNFRNHMEWIAAATPHTFAGALARAKQENQSISNRIRNMLGNWFS